MSTTSSKLAASSDDAGSRVPKGALTALVLSVVVTLALPHVPYVRYITWPLMLLSTLVHELGHGIAGVLVGGTFRSFEMFADGSGVAQVSHGGGRFAAAMVSAGGLVGPALAAAGLFVLARKEKLARLGLGLVAGLAVLSVVLVVRNLFGVAFVLSFAVITGAIVKFGSPWFARFSLVFLAVQLALSVYSRGDYLFTKVANTANGPMPSDVAQMSEALFLPYWFWGAACGLTSVVVLLVGAWFFLRAEKTSAV